MFFKVKEDLKGQNFRGSQGCSTPVIWGVRKYFFGDEIKKRVKHWHKCIKVEGDYVKK
jgi:hypothetical protein